MSRSVRLGVAILIMASTLVLQSCGGDPIPAPAPTNTVSTGATSTVEATPTSALDAQEPTPTISNADKPEASIVVKGTGSSNVYSVAFSPDGKTIAAGSDAHAVLVNVADGKIVQDLSTGIHEVISVAFSPDGKSLVTASGDNFTNIKVWQVSDGSIQGTMEDPYPVNEAVFSPDGKTILSAAGNAAGIADKPVKFWNVADGSLRRALDISHSVLGAEFSPDGKTVAYAPLDGSIVLVKSEDGTEIRKLSGHTDFVSTIAFSPNGQTLVSGANDASVRVWNLTDGSVVQTMAGLSEGPRAVAVSPDGQIIAATVADTILLWNAADGKLVHTIHAPNRLWGLAFSPDGKKLASGSVADLEDGRIELWPVP